MASTPGSDPSSAARATDDVRAAISFMTRLPVGRSERDLAQACWAFPIAGLLIGFAGGGAFALSFSWGVPSVVAALLALLTMALLTGALHEDGLADTADGLAGNTPERRLEIMRDSRIGVYGVLALIFSVGLRGGALAAMSEPGTGFAALLAAAALSRGLLPGMMYVMPLASASGLAAGVGTPTRGAAGLAMGIGAFGAVVFLGLGAGVGIMLLAGTAVVVIALLARRTLGGYNGDTLGAAQQVAEIAILIGIAGGL